MDRKPIHLQPITPGFEEEIKSQQDAQPQTTPTSPQPLATDSSSATSSTPYQLPSQSVPTTPIAQPQSIIHDSPLVAKGSGGTNASLIMVTILGVLMLLINGYDVIRLAPSIGHHGAYDALLWIMCMFAGFGVAIGVGLILHWHFARTAALWLEGLALITSFIGLISNPIGSITSIIVAIAIISLLNTKSVRSAFSA